LAVSRLMDTEAVGFRVQTGAVSWRPGRTALPRGARALPASPRRESRRRGEDRADTTSHTHSRSPSPFISRFCRAHRGAKRRRHCRHTLSRGRASSPSRHSHPNPVHRSARVPSTSSILYLSQSCEGTAVLPSPPPSASGVSRRSATVVVAVLL
jgi:hypothetical protein